MFYSDKATKEDIRNLIDSVVNSTYVTKRSVTSENNRGRFVRMLASSFFVLDGNPLRPADLSKGAKANGLLDGWEMECSFQTIKSKNKGCSCGCEQMTKEFKRGFLERNRAKAAKKMG